MSTSELHWFKSSYSDSSNPSDCVEIATTPATIHIRDSKTPHTPHLTLTPATWTGFLAYVSGK
ncbi:toxin [Streptomyces avermitilis]|uniref:DUF397 domain-containing protein n=2 Tax=Streptomyces avermitilis TaxID=33903 RepID=Q82H95_STRAW|nr:MULTISPECIES: DUF397 domain-containing protein [Streptomyces]KUN56773.1 toxin [Streptomyces avermitilis]MYS99208.1 DUF397 domain-containing protein [Streptomyces sp. SID5469]OOV32502.1 DUF397 domain-containing protein [Streptomyces avermitilis]BAC71327.1 hypothetical protein SAVERM_3615 [Streptomyces avermitilis MA-4680 = NBRC 14893]GDY63561.1 DUF397 domain-containing protein [Streptomyces avermitilis]